MRSTKPISQFSPIAITIKMMIGTNIVAVSKLFAELMMTAPRPEIVVKNSAITIATTARPTARRIPAMGDTANSVNQGGASGSTGIQFGGKQMRMASAEARRVLVEMAAGLLSTPVEQLVVNDGFVSSRADAAKRISYEQMLGGKYFNVQLDWNKQFGNTLYAPGKAQPKNPSEHKIVGQPIKREDVAPKVFAQEDFVTDVKVPGMAGTAEGFTEYLNKYVYEKKAA